MLSIIIAFPKIEDATNIKNMLVRSGYDVTAVCTMGAQVASLVNDLDCGIVICGYRLQDMHYGEIHDCLPKGFEMLLIASAQKLEYCTNNDIVCLSMPIRTTDLMNTLEMMSFNYRKRKKKERLKEKVRSDEDKEIIHRAKIILMDRNNMTEEEAHRYIQKYSMDSGTNMVEMAEMILAML